MRRSELVSVIIPCYQCAQTLSATLDSILMQSFRDFKIYCINDGSRDETVGIIQHYQKRYPGCIVLLDQENQGQTIAKNNGIKICDGSFVAFCDSDDIWSPDKLLHQVQVMNTQPEVALCYTDGFFIDIHGTQEGPIGTLPALQGNCFESLLLGNGIVASSVMVRKEALDAVGIFDTTLRACENWELWTRIAYQWQLYCIKEPLIGYRRHDNNMSHNHERMREARVQVIQKNAERYATYPNINHLVKEAFFKAYFFFGEDALWKGKPQTARENLFRALCYQPLHMRTYGLLLKSLLGKKGIEFARRIRSTTSTT